jgi:hypothetical protein
MTTSVRSTAERPRVLLLALNYKPGDRVFEYIEFLIAADVDVDFVVTDDATIEAVRENPAAAALLADPHVSAHALMPSEHGHPMRRVERLFLYRAPAAALAVVPGGGVKRLQEKVSDGVHWRLFMPFYRMLRPYLLARRASGLQRRVDVRAVERIVAGDISAVALGWRLARRFPGAVATTALDRPPYAARTTGGHRTETAAAADPHAAVVPDSAAPEPSSSAD